jgi:hypothetical protein
MEDPEMKILHKNFDENVKKHLSQYREKTLNIKQCGIYKENGKPYAHILPGSDWGKNILPSKYQDDIINYISQNEVKIDQNILHLNSSQALCFNLFIPLLLENRCDIINKDIIPNNMRFEFEHIENEKEGTNFDLFIEQDNQKHFFEIKYTESGFGSGNKKKLEKKYNDVYIDTIKKFKFLERDPERFYKHYQLFRNMFYCLKGQVYFVLPKAREDLIFTINWRKNRYCPNKYVEKIKIITIEEILDNINAKITDKKLLEHYTLFREKYLIENIGGAGVTGTDLA